MWLPQKCCQPSKDLFWMYPCYFHGSPSCSQPGLESGLEQSIDSFRVRGLVWYVWDLLRPSIAQSQQVALWTPPSISTFRNVDFQCFIIQSFFSSGDFARSIPSHPFWYSCSGPPGTYGTVYRARDTETGDIVALKKAISSAAKIGRKKGSPDTDNSMILCMYVLICVEYVFYVHIIYAA